MFCSAFIGIMCQEKRSLEIFCCLTEVLEVLKEMTGKEQCEKFLLKSWSIIHIHTAYRFRARTVADAIRCQNDRGDQ